MMLMTACAPNTVVRTVDSACDWDQVILVTDNDILVMHPDTKRDILVHNETLERVCQKK